MSEQVNPQGQVINAKDVDGVVGYMPVLTADTSDAKVDFTGYLYTEKEVNGIAGRVPVVEVEGVEGGTEVVFPIGSIAKTELGAIGVGDDVSGKTALEVLSMALFSKPTVRITLSPVIDGNSLQLKLTVNRKMPIPSMLVSVAFIVISKSGQKISDVAQAYIYEGNTSVICNQPITGGVDRIMSAKIIDITPTDDDRYIFETA